VAVAATRIMRTMSPTAVHTPFERVPMEGGFLMGWGKGEALEYESLERDRERLE